jgi:hypothetical protein
MGPHFDDEFKDNLTNLIFTFLLGNTSLKLKTKLKSINFFTETRNYKLEKFKSQINSSSKLLQQ